MVRPVGAQRIDSKGPDQVAEPRKLKTPPTARAKANRGAKPGAKPGAKDAVEDAVVVGETRADADTKPKAPEDDAAADASARGDASAEKAPTGAEDPAKAAAKADTPAEPPAGTDAAEPGPEPAAPPVATAVAPPPAPPRGEFWPLVAGGVAAAILGAVAFYLAERQGWVQIGSGTEELAAEVDRLRGALDGATAEIAALQDGLAGIAPVTDAARDLAAADQRIEREIADIAAGVEALGDRLGATDARLAAVETQPIPMADLPAEIAAAYEVRLAQMLASVDARFQAMLAEQDGRFATLAAEIGDKLTAIEAAQSAAAAAQDAAARAADAAAARGALARIVAALDSGAGFAEPLGTLREVKGVEVPPALSEAAETGVASLASLQQSFPGAAREALAVSTREAAEGGAVSPWQAFVRTQLGARSLSPREGDDPDAVLSRAEAALGKGDLDTALAEIAALPRIGQDAMAAWVARAETRRAALAAAQALAAEYETN